MDKVMKRCYFSLLLILPLYCLGQYKGGPQDGVARLLISNQNRLPLIYNGGAQDGYAAARINNQNKQPEIYTGGNQDGVANTIITEQNISPGIYSGGEDDGISFASIVDQNAAYNIYTGGNQDGVDVDTKLGQNLIPLIYKGGISDGVDNTLTTNENRLPEIYLGDIDDGYSFAITLNQNPLPTRSAGALLQLSGKWSDNDALLSWTTGAEPELDHFELERSDNEGKDFTKILSAEPDKNPGDLHDYGYKDAGAYDLPENFMLYRLKCVSKDGSAKYSALVRLSKDKTTPAFAVFPNPSSGHFTLSLMNVQDLTGYEYTLATADGKKIGNSVLKEISTSFDLSAKTAGAYILSVLKNGKQIQSFTIVIAY